MDLRVGRRLRLKGSLGMSGAGVNDYVYGLEDRGDKTLLRLTHHALGYKDPETEGRYVVGWNGLSSQLRSWLEKGEASPPVYM